MGERLSQCLITTGSEGSREDTSEVWWQVEDGVVTKFLCGSGRLAVLPSVGYKVFVLEDL